MARASSTGATSYRCRSAEASIVGVAERQPVAVGSSSPTASTTKLSASMIANTVCSAASNVAMSGGSDAGGIDPRSAGSSMRLTRSPPPAVPARRALSMPPNIAAPIAWPRMRVKMMVEVAMPRWLQPLPDWTATI